ncbi:MAG: tRNA 2-thiouridine(34) synthase MnmA [Candidatus Omnitrophica bacterium]|nr:tRNA 2-thiouridine(34) synthase MnmA [Candidatus Omnitrophota bacterium]
MNTKTKKIVVAMSGGVDSSVAAALLVEAGHEVIGVTIKLWPGGECEKDRPLKSCCSLSAIDDARSVADMLNIRHHVVDFSKEAQSELIDYFCREYSHGRTPNPCIVCNEKLKFGKLLEWAKKLGCDHVATGHYARSEETGGRYILKEADYKDKDQSYVLFSLTQEQLASAIFPLAGKTKDEVRALAAKLGLKVHDKVESQEICFVEGDYRDLLKEKKIDGLEPGDIVDGGGLVLGRHKGFASYTLGQRKGLGIANSQPLYVTRIEPETNRIVVGIKDDVKRREFLVKGINWISQKPSDEKRRADVKIRSQHKKALATLHMIDDSVKVIFDQPQEAPTPGQAAVFYDKDTVLGGGWIEESY